MSTYMSGDPGLLLLFDGKGGDLADQADKQAPWPFATHAVANMAALLCSHFTCGLTNSTSDTMLMHFSLAITT